MYFEYEQTTVRHSWPTTTDMTRGDTYPSHIDFRMTKAELDTHMGGMTCGQTLEVKGVAG
jgi:hypothetical protein